MTKLKSFNSLCRTIIGVGRNYSEHAKELGNAVPTKPLLFMKPPATLISQGQKIEIPIGCQEIHHEIELGIVINGLCRQVSEKEAMKYVGGYVLALDMTARDFQNEAKSKGWPWAMAKGFDTSCPVSELIEKDKITDPANVHLKCWVNGDLRQHGHTKDMIFSVPKLISFISNYFSLNEGDLILTGTPAGVGPVKEGDVIRGEMTGVTTMEFSVVQRK